MTGARLQRRERLPPNGHRVSKSARAVFSTDHPGKCLDVAERLRDGVLSQAELIFEKYTDAILLENIRLEAPGARVVGSETGTADRAGPAPAGREVGNGSRPSSMKSE